jgi:hypothetical protein
VEFSAEEVVMSDRVATVAQSALAAIVTVAAIAWQAELIEGWIAGPVALLGAAGSFMILRGVERKYREYVFEPLGPKDISATLGRHFETHTPALQQSGFQRVGDFRFLPPPIPELARVFISADGECFAAITLHAEIDYISFTSMTADGTQFESATLHTGGDGPSASVPLRLQYLDTMSIAEGFQRHRQFVREYATLHGVDTVVCGPEDFRHVYEYGHRLVGWDLFHKGRRRTAPPPLPNFFSQPAAAVAGEPAKQGA